MERLSRTLSFRNRNISISTTSSNVSSHSSFSNQLANSTSVLNLNSHISYKTYLDIQATTTVIESVQLLVPKPFKACIEYLETNGSIEGLFRVSGSVKRIKFLQEHFANPAFDFDLFELKSKSIHTSDLNNFTVHDVAGLFKKNLSSVLHFDPLINDKVYEEVRASYSYYENGTLDQCEFLEILVDTLSQLEMIKLHLFVVLLAFLGHVSTEKYTSVTRMSSSNLAIVFQPYLFDKKNELSNLSVSSTDELRKSSIHSIGDDLETNRKIVEFFTTHSHYLVTQLIARLKIAESSDIPPVIEEFSEQDITEKIAAPNPSIAQQRISEQDTTEQESTEQDSTEQDITEQDLTVQQLPISNTQIPRISVESVEKLAENPVNKHLYEQPNGSTSTVDSTNSPTTLKNYSFQEEQEKSSMYKQNKRSSKLFEFLEVYSQPLTFKKKPEVVNERDEESIPILMVPKRDSNEGEKKKKMGLIKRSFSLLKKKKEIIVN